MSQTKTKQPQKKFKSKEIRQPELPTQRAPNPAPPPAAPKAQAPPPEKEKPKAKERQPDWSLTGPLDPEEIECRKDWEEKVAAATAAKKKP